MHDDAIRTIVAIPNQQLDMLDVLCRRDGISRAEAALEHHHITTSHITTLTDQCRP